MDFDQCIMTQDHHYTIKQNTSTALKILCALPIHPSLPPTPGNHWSFNCLHSLAFSTMPWSWSRTARSLIRLFFFFPLLVIGIQGFSKSFHGFTAQLFLAPNVSLFGCTTAYFSIYLLKDMLVASKLQ